MRRRTSNGSEEILKGWTGMRFSKIGFMLGWILAICGMLACTFLLVMLRDLRAMERLTAVQLIPHRSATILPVDWDSDKRRVLLVGDSRIRRWDVLPTSEDVVFAKSGVGGETTGQLERRFQNDVLNIEPAPDKIIIAAGINDLVAASVQRKYNETFRTNVSDQMVERLVRLAQLAQAHGIEARIATIIQPASPDIVRRLTYWDDNLYELVADANAHISIVTSENGIKLIDFNATLNGGDGPLQDDFSDDTLHFSPDAYRVLSDWLSKDDSFK